MWVSLLATLPGEDPGQAPVRCQWWEYRACLLTQLGGVKVDRMDSHRNDSHIVQKLFVLHKWSPPLFIVI